MNKVKLILLACPAVLASMLMAANPLYAGEVVPKSVVESKPVEPLFEVVFEQETPESPTLEFTESESNAAIQRFGCDCSSCLNAGRQLQGKLPLL